MPQSAPTTDAPDANSSFNVKNKMGNLLSKSVRNQKITKSVVSSRQETNQSFGASRKELNRAVNRNSMKIDSFNPALRKSLLDGIKDLEEGNDIRDTIRTNTLPNVVEAEEEEVDLEDFILR